MAVQAGVTRPDRIRLTVVTPGGDGSQNGPSPFLFSTEEQREYIPPSSDRPALQELQALPAWREDKRDPDINRVARIRQGDVPRRKRLDSTRCQGKGVGGVAIGGSDAEVRDPPFGGRFLLTLGKDLQNTSVPDIQHQHASPFQGATELLLKTKPLLVKGNSLIEVHYAQGDVVEARPLDGLIA